MPEQDLIVRFDFSCELRTSIGPALNIALNLLPFPARRRPLGPHSPHLNHRGLGVLLSDVRLLKRLTRQCDLGRETPNDEMAPTIEFGDAHRIRRCQFQIKFSFETCAAFLGACKILGGSLHRFNRDLAFGFHIG
ncbi:hypothetical protein AC629_29500 [Bradyrhizobium sp. NAS80.1]|nr:hypothetical protein AC629_29500 [Bradyrhizobium sp. NAS80.1]